MSYHQVTSFILFLIISLSIFFIPINDTDETYGYWEPLHYMVFNRGMKTWEYDASFGLRSYAFLVPFAMILKLLNHSLTMVHTYLFPILNFFDLKVFDFYFLRFLLAVLSSYALNSFIYSLYCRVFFQEHFLAILTLLFYYSSHGLIIGSLSFLPSSLAMIFLLFSLSKWLEDKKISSIFFGCLAVLYTGWPFVGVIFLPIGLHMLFSAWSKPFQSSFILPTKTKEPTVPTNQTEKNQVKNQIFAGQTSASSNSPVPTLGLRFFAVLSLIFQGLVVLVSVLLLVLCLDSLFYGQMTFPALRIVKYNVFGAQNDHLYGVESSDYYVRNLLLNFNFVAVFFLFFPVIYFLNFLVNRENQWGNDSYSLTMIAMTYLWLGVMFSREHKEERFLFPVFPLISYLGSLFCLSCYQCLIKILYPSSFKKDSVPFKKGKWFYMQLLGVFSLVFSANLLRNMAVYRNFSGVLKGWENFSTYLNQSRTTEAIKPLQVCMGNEWYTFPTHFFLPPHAQLAYIEDEFRGILPQPFAENPAFSEGNDKFLLYINHDGTALPSLLPSNDQNKEETSRYLPLEACDFLVTSDAKWGAILRERELGDESVVAQPILHSEATKSLYRSFYLPFTAQHVVYKDYTFYKLK